jgi:hypothetical protein
MIENFLQPDTKIFADLFSFSIFDNNLLTRTMNKYWDYDNDNYKIKAGFDSCLCETNILMGKAVNSKDTRNIDEHDKEDN